MNRSLFAAVLVAITFAASASDAQAPAVRRGTLYIVGGGPQPPALVQEFVDLAGGRGKARIVVFAMASESGLSGGEEKAVDLRALGAEARNVWVTREQALTDSVAHLLDGVTGIWFGGGDQVRLADVLRGTPTERAIHARYAAGAVVGGTSAGAAVMSAVMLTGDERAPGGTRPDTTLSWVTIARDNTITTTGFGLIDDVIIDQHFLRRKRHNRLISLVLEREPHLGAGIDESTALVVHADGTWSVRGASVVTVYDARQAVVTPAGQVLGATGLRMHVLPAGATFDPRTGTAVLEKTLPR
ncbi:MAG: cyanophycinase [Gemmatimonadetes bacterium]|nr:cyanophycinase [Gemmatimonadota bacterium]